MISPSPDQSGNECDQTKELALQIDVERRGEALITRDLESSKDSKQVSEYDISGIECWSWAVADDFVIFMVTLSSRCGHVERCGV